MRVLRDLELSDFATFTTLCRFTWDIGGPVPLVFDLSDAIHGQQGIFFSQFFELESLALSRMGVLPAMLAKASPNLSMSATAICGCVSAKAG